VPVTGVIYTNLKRLPDSRVSGNLQTVYYMTRETNPERRAAEEADWVPFFGVEKVCTLGAAGMASEEMYSAPAQLALEDGERIQARTNGTRTIQDFLPQASEILAAPISNPMPMVFERCFHTCPKLRFLLYLNDLIILLLDDAVLVCDSYRLPKSLRSFSQRTGTEPGPN